MSPSHPTGRGPSGLSMSLSSSSLTSILMPARFWKRFRRSRALSNCSWVTSPQLYLVLTSTNLSHSLFRAALSFSGGGAWTETDSPP